jgi:hypothetical protein
MAYAPGWLYGPEHGHPTADEAAAQLALAQRSIVASPRDLRVHAAATVGGGALLALVFLAVDADYPTHFVIPTVLLLAALSGALQFWEFRAGRVVPRDARRVRGWGTWFTVASTVLLSSFTRLPAAVVLVLAVVPCVLAAGVTILRGPR